MAAGDVAAVVLLLGAAHPRLRRHQELLQQLKQQLAAAELRDYHNAQVSLPPPPAGHTAI
jgi:hypothetical protein